MNEEHDAIETVAGEVRKASGRALLWGILTIVVGVLAIGSPLVAGGAIAIIAGISLVIGGVLELLSALGDSSGSSRGWAFLSGALSLVCGVFLLAKPLQAIIALTLLIAIYFFLDGVSRIVLAFQVKPARGWKVFLFGGIVALLLGICMWRQWPISGVVAIGILVGIRLIFAGWTMIALGSVGRAVTKPAS
jgi:uncharacterized membrane protein HdeD (DUF308 family)